MDKTVLIMEVINNIVKARGGVSVFGGVGEMFLMRGDTTHKQPRSSSPFHSNKRTNSYISESTCNPV